MNSGRLAPSFFLQIRTHHSYKRKGYIVYSEEHILLEANIHLLFKTDNSGKLCFSKLCKKYLWDIIKFILYVKRRNIRHRKISFT
ncbi:hypothetical protein AXF42_Ash021371 [Apostasia shenzhenica]|uniref:Uncharacterized protein n=1 Tax=Apostasia shenzhenica TaxID=1088818 RepID=A0A2H9ZYJ0_9ASPA|nr:hypothetical protein AXF42_Ash021371 [Apostasia shenzhenica]